ncbi:MAG TPA: hypothetical protein VGP89_03475 [Candidatus Angelobacter sp.]|jgi:hypothetical protein|nr:hypothetical protein [Candidatus Angelobacter sp.]
MRIRAKFQVQEITSLHFYPNSKIIKLRPQYDTATPEDNRFSTATPSGELWMQVDNPSAVAALEQGKFFYIDIFPTQDPVEPVAPAPSAIQAEQAATPAPAQPVAAEPQPAVQAEPAAVAEQAQPATQPEQQA